MGGRIDAETVFEKNAVMLVGLLGVSAALTALIYGVYALEAGGELLALLVSSTLLGCLGAGYLWLSEGRVLAD